MSVKRDVPFRRIHAEVATGRMVDVFDALCLLRSRKPHQLVHDIVLEHLQAAEHEPNVQQAIRARRRHRAGLRVVS